MNPTIFDPTLRLLSSLSLTGIQLSISTLCRTTFVSRDLAGSLGKDKRETLVRRCLYTTFVDQTHFIYPNVFTLYLKPATIPKCLYSTKLYMTHMLKRFGDSTKKSGPPVSSRIVNTVPGNVTEMVLHLKRLYSQIFSDSFESQNNRVFPG